MPTEESLAKVPREVTCAHLGCGITWTPDDGDIRLTRPDHSWFCGLSHNPTQIAYRHLARLALRHGYVWGSISCEESSPTQYASLNDRYHRRTGHLEWSSYLDLVDTEALVSKIEWDSENWRSRAFSRRGLDHPPGAVRWVGYNENGQERQYTFVTCVRCQGKISVDLADPDHRPYNYVIGASGGGDAPVPAWWGRTFRCEDTSLPTFSTQPCHLVHGEVVAEFERVTGHQWTMWQGGSQSGTVVFCDLSSKNRYGLLCYGSPEPFRSVSSLLSAIEWGTADELSSTLRVLVPYGEYNTVLGKLEIFHLVPT